MTALTKGEIAELIKRYEVWVTTRTSILDTAVVPESRIRRVLMIEITGDEDQTRTVDIEQAEEDGDYTMKWSNIPIAPADMRQIPNAYNTDQPIINVQGGADLVATAYGNSVQIMTTYYDAGRI